VWEVEKGNTHCLRVISVYSQDHSLLKEIVAMLKEGEIETVVDKDILPKAVRCSFQLRKAAIDGQKNFQVVSVLRLLKPQSGTYSDC